MKRKECIMMELDELYPILKELFKDTDGFDVECNPCDGIYFDGVSNEEVYTALGDYIGELVSSIHTDHCDYQLVWVVLQD